MAREGTPLASGIEERATVPTGLKFYLRSYQLPKLISPLVRRRRRSPESVRLRLRGSRAGQRKGLPPAGGHRPPAGGMWKTEHSSHPPSRIWGSGLRKEEFRGCLTLPRMPPRNRCGRILTHSFLKKTTTRPSRGSSSRRDS